MPKGLIPIIYNEISERAAKDEIDVLHQVDAVSEALKQLDFTVSKHPFSSNPKDIIEALQATNPLFIFNLVEMVGGSGKLSYLAPSIFEALNIRYTGNSAEAIFLTTNKVVTKKILRSHGIPTAPWVTCRDEHAFLEGDRYIIKPVYEDGSVGLSQDSIVRADSIHQLREILTKAKERTRKDHFAERYIEGREIKCYVIGNNGGTMILPPNEIKFMGYKEMNIDPILGFSANWESDSFEYKNTISSGVFDDGDKALIQELETITKRCWDEFGLNGYAGVDFRIDEDGRPWVLEINANPCITPDESGFIRSAARAGLDYLAVVERIISEV